MLAHVENTAVNIINSNKLTDICTYFPVCIPSMIQMLLLPRSTRIHELIIPSKNGLSKILSNSYSTLKLIYVIWNEHKIRMTSRPY